ncbi:murein DD-endopeptidase MepM/ murein hydrolase activator NlpD [Hypnocyclicus thermotrophus]|uniref:Murein DD-endopeptidase MepM/ murein hydrolase activator NlpD n=1 Tax=Hypnocyclicus thermotrophus TaxID=1627895 RepID=A0AA46DXQ0_9FUSO|nr:peptidoglycan DD-metalloendopeptidase family protein [Hypnocyclicus thermotrophus]TDT68600.1 murein DD-endopeptidase MepM/ murein hydrolase activator NlpD [Hypnocyclicus thermotrophus]
MNRQYLKGLLLVIILGIVGLTFFKKTKSDEILPTDKFVSYKEAIKEVEGTDKIEEGSQIEDGGVEILDDNTISFEKEYVVVDKEPIDESKEIKVTYYTVQKGDSLYKISSKLGIDMNYLIANNPTVKNGIIRIGQKLKIVNDNNIEYIVQSGDSLFKIAKKYNVKMDDIISKNDLDTTNLIVGDKLIIENPDLSFINKTINQGPNFKWPIRYLGVTSPYGKRFHPVLKRNIFHAGVDLRARVGTNLYAPEDGTVKTAGWLGGYGKIIIIKHSNGYETRMAHLNNIYVKVGQKVTKGQLIGKTGQTGRVTGPHLHFEIRKNGKTLNPMKFRK